MPGTLRWTWLNRAPEGRKCNCTSGKFTAPVVEPVMK